MHKPTDQGRSACKLLRESSLMEDAKSYRLDQFLEYFSAVHALEGAYVCTDGDTVTDHQSASLHLFQESIPFLEAIPKSGIRTVLDVGLGYGHHSVYFADRGFQVTGITTHCTAALQRLAETKRFTFRQMDMHWLDFEDETFDLVWSHHSLEHTFSPMLALREWLRVLKKEGLLAVTVPPHKAEIVSGHFNVGWSVGQLIYLLGVCGYEIRSGRFVEEGYNVRALVRRPLVPKDPSGKSWIFKLKGDLPEAICAGLHEAPASMGRYSFNGALKLVDGSLSVEK